MNKWKWEEEKKLKSFLLCDIRNLLFNFDNKKKKKKKKKKKNKKKKKIKKNK